MKIVLVAAVLVAVLDGSSAHQLKWGGCPTATPMSGFDPAKMAGNWFVIKKLVTTSTCMMAKFGVDGENTMTLQELRTPSLTQMGPFDVTVTNVGKLTMDPNNKASMTLQWSGIGSSLVTTRYTMLDTDYLNYGLDFECQSLGIFHRLSATIYSRTNTLPQATIDKLELLLAPLKVDLSRLSVVDHSNCQDLEGNDFNIKVDANGLSLLGVLTDKEIIALDTKEKAQEYAENNIPKE